MNPCFKVWAKTGEGSDLSWHPLLLHMLDVAACADAILEREPESTRKRMGVILGMEWSQARPWILLAIACHDLGKACPGFQCKWKNMTDLDVGRSPNTDINHAYVSQISLATILQKKGWTQGLAEFVADAVGCHHGTRSSPSSLERLSGDRRALGKEGWAELRENIVDALSGIFLPEMIPSKDELSGPDFMLLSGLTSFSDWIGSNRDYFSFGHPEDCEDLQAWFQQRRARAYQALNAIGWGYRTPLATEPKTFEHVFDLPPRPLQEGVQEALSNMTEPGILLVEAPMGEGKTEAAFFAYLELQRRFGHRGLYVALPTRATGNAMFKRTINFLHKFGMNRILDLQLLHGGGLLNEAYQELKVSGVYDPETGGGIRAGEWFTDKKRGLLSEYGVGTVDQALLPILPVRHHFVRLWGLANRVVVFDEIHAYDTYTGTLLVHLIRWLLALGSSVILLSATLPPSIRKKILEIGGGTLPEQEAAYPRLSVHCLGNPVRQQHFESDPSRRLTVRVKGIPASLPDIATALDENLSFGMGLALFNTVQRAQDFYRFFPDGEILERNGQRVGKRLPDGTEIILFHARFPGDRRQIREEYVLDTFGKKYGIREGRKILIATQVAEQSLDLDFDLIVTDLAPIDLVLQRAGRLWRHNRSSRPVSEPTLMVAGLNEATPPSFGKPLWWGKVYREDVLLRTWICLQSRESLTLPDDIDDLVQTVYEEREAVPEFLQDRMDKAMSEEGKAMVHKGQANQAVIGFPVDASWNDPARFVLYDEDSPDVHRSLMAQTRLGEDAVMAIPLVPNDVFDISKALEAYQEKEWFLRSVRLSRKNVVLKLKGIGVPDRWKDSSLLRNCFPLILDDSGLWTEEPTVRLDENMGIVYETKEVL